MKLISIYQCLRDETRLRILNLLSVSPLCVCHIQQVIGKSQVISSQHLAYLRERGMACRARRHGHWMIYSLPPSPSAGLEANLKCLQDCVQTEPVFKKDRAKLKKLTGNKAVRDLLGGGMLPETVATPQSLRMKKCISEFIGTFALVFAGTGAIVINDTSGGSITHVGIALTFGLVVMVMIYALGDISGAHLNPAVTLGFFAARCLPRAQKFSPTFPARRRRARLPPVLRCVFYFQRIPRSGPRSPRARMRSPSCLSSSSHFSSCS